MYLWLGLAFVFSGSKPALLPSCHYIFFIYNINTFIAGLGIQGIKKKDYTVTPNGPAPCAFALRRDRRGK